MIWESNRKTSPTTISVADLVNSPSLLPFFLCCCLPFAGCAERNGEAVESDPEIVSAAGQTMGTYYAVTIANPPAGLGDDWVEQVDAELRRVNDQMSTFLKSSEISRFNDSESTDWFSVSPETAMVVAKALEVSAATDGAFDVTVGPLVDAWNFGTTKRTAAPPSDEQIEALRAVVGYENLQARLDPPALRKQIAELRVDLSAIAKGHGVDRVLELLESQGCEHVFVDVGGEDRAIGRRGNRPWRVAIEEPDEGKREYRMAIELKDQAIATSGDYRNFFEYEGQRFSHTIDPRSGRPVTHGVASVSVMAEDCMTADAWATAITVLGAEAGMEIAHSEGFEVRIVERGSQGRFRVTQSKNFPENIFSRAGAEQ